MRNYFLAAAAIAALSSPALARDGQPYVGIEGGILFPMENDGDAFVDFTTTQTPLLPLGPAGPLDFASSNAFGLDYNTGYDIDLIAGYDFGMFRIEGELGFKRAKLDELNVDDGFVSALNVALNRPSAAPDPGAPGLPALIDTDFDLDGKVRVLSGMVNGLVDFGNEDGISFYAGAGIGYAKVKLFGESDSAFAWQLIAGMRYAVSSNIDLGLKYRYFRTGDIHLSDDSVAFAGNPDRQLVGVDPVVTVDQTTNAVLLSDFENNFRSHSLLASLIFNFGAREEYVPPPPPPPPPPPEAPATQTCFDGSVILATDMCPAPPPPPPPPPPEPIPERG